MLLKQNIGLETHPHPASPKYDKLKSQCGFKVFIVVFGGGAAGGGGCSFTLSASPHAVHRGPVMVTQD